MVKQKISQEEMARVKRQFILENMRLSPVEAAALLNIKVRTYYRLVDEGLIPQIPLRPGQIRGSKCTAQGLEEYRRKVLGDAYEPLDLKQYAAKLF